jgi:hypothetical protein
MEALLRKVDADFLAMIKEAEDDESKAAENSPLDGRFIIYIYIYIYIYIHICLYLYIYICKNMYINKYINIDIYVGMYKCVYLMFIPLTYVFIYMPFNIIAI